MTTIRFKNFTLILSNGKDVILDKKGKVLVEMISSSQPV